MSGKIGPNKSLDAPDGNGLIGDGHALGLDNAAIPDDAFVLESDSPDMPLAGRQGQRNEPACLTETLAQVARLRGQAPEEVAAKATANTRRLFGLSCHGATDASA